MQLAHVPNSAPSVALKPTEPVTIDATVSDDDMNCLSDVVTPQVPPRALRAFASPSDADIDINVPAAIRDSFQRRPMGPDSGSPQGYFVQDLAPHATLPNDQLPQMKSWRCVECATINQPGTPREWRCTQCGHQTPTVRMFMGQLRRRSSVHSLLWMLSTVLPEVVVYHVDNCVNQTTGRDRGCAWVYVHERDESKIFGLHKRVLFDHSPEGAAVGEGFWMVPDVEEAKVALLRLIGMRGTHDRDLPLCSLVVERSSTVPRSNAPPKFPAASKPLRKQPRSQPQPQPEQSCIRCSSTMHHCSYPSTPASAPLPVPPAPVRCACGGTTQVPPATHYQQPSYPTPHAASLPSPAAPAMSPYPAHHTTPYPNPLSTPQHSALPSPAMSPMSYGSHAPRPTTYDLNNDSFNGASNYRPPQSTPEPSPLSGYHASPASSAMSPYGSYYSPPPTTSVAPPAPAPAPSPYHAPVYPPQQTAHTHHAHAHAPAPPAPVPASTAPTAPVYSGCQCTECMSYNQYSRPASY